MIKLRQIYNLLHKKQLFWTEEIEQGEFSQLQQQNKKSTLRSQRILEEIDEFESNWIIWKIVARFLSENSKLLDAETYSALVARLAASQSALKTISPHQEFIAEVAIQLLQCEKIFPNVTRNVIDDWHKIMQFAVKKINRSKDNLRMLRATFESGYFVSPTFVKGIFHEISNETLTRSNESIELFISILKNLNLNLLDSPDELKITVLKWLKSTSVRQMISGETNTDPVLIAELCTLCCLSKLNNDENRICKSENIETQSSIDRLKVDYSYQTLQSFIAVEIKSQTKQKPMSYDLPKRNEIQVLLNEKVFKEFENLLSCAKSIQSADNFIIADKLYHILHGLNQFLLYRVYDEDAFRSSEMMKPIMNHLERYSVILNDQMTCDDRKTREIINGIYSIWATDFHPRIKRMIFKGNMSVILFKWLQKQMTKSPKHDSNILQVIDSLNVDDEQQLKLLSVLVQLAKHSEVSAQAVDVLDNYEWNLDNNEHIFMLNKLIKVNKQKVLWKKNLKLTFCFTLRQLCLKDKSPPAVVRWAFDSIKDLCEKFVTDHRFFEIISENIPSELSKINSSESKFNLFCFVFSDLIAQIHVLEQNEEDDLIHLLSVAVKLAIIKSCGPTLSIQMISYLKFYAKVNNPIIVDMMHLLILFT